MTRIVDDFVIERPRDSGVRIMFGYPSDGINGTFAALQRADCPSWLVQVRHEEMAAFIGAAYAKFSRHRTVVGHDERLRQAADDRHQLALSGIPAERRTGALRSDRHQDFVPENARSERSQPVWRQRRNAEGAAASNGPQDRSRLARNDRAPRRRQKASLSGGLAWIGATVPYAIAAKFAHPGRLGAAWDEALASDQPVVIEVKTDPEAPSLAPHISFEQVHKFMGTIAKGDSGGTHRIIESARQVLSSILPGGKK